MSTPTQTQLQTGLSGAVGCDYSASESKLYFVAFDTGNFSSLTVPPTPVVHDVLGTGYNNPEDVKLSADGIHAYITERSGDLVRLALKTPDRSAATVVTSGITAPQQMFLDEAHDSAYVVEFSTPGRLLKVNLTSGAKTVIASGLDNPIGVVVDSSRQYAYITEQTTGPDQGRVSKNPGKQRPADDARKRVDCSVLLDLDGPVRRCPLRPPARPLQFHPHCQRD